jgi:hypothetical protein
MIAAYRLDKHICSFDFFDWLVMVAADGAKEIVFNTANPRTGKWPADVVLKRFASIIEPGPALIGLPHRFGDDVGQIEQTTSQLLDWVRSGRMFPRLASILPPIPGKFTVTIRDNDTAKERDSNQEAWRRFASAIGADVIEDNRVKPIHLHERMARYAGAAMNFGVCNGPVHMISLSNYPLTLVVNNAKAEKSMRKKGMLPEHGKYPWMMRNQMMAWAEDSYDNLMRIFEASQKS